MSVWLPLVYSVSIGLTLTVNLVNWDLQPEFATGICNRGLQPGFATETCNKARGTSTGHGGLRQNFSMQILLLVSAYSDVHSHRTSGRVHLMACHRLFTNIHLVRLI